FGIEQEHFLGLLAGPSPEQQVALGVIAVGLVVVLARAPRPGRALSGLLGRSLWAVAGGAVAWLLARTLLPGGRPGTLVTTLTYVGVGVAVQYGLGLGLAVLCAQQIAGRRFFRVVFLLPMMITPVGIAYTFRILMDLGKGPFAPAWRGLTGRGVVGQRPVGCPDRRDDRRRVAVDAVHVRRAAGRSGESAA